MLSPRWMKVVSDLRVHRARTLLVVLAITVGLVGSGSVLNTYSILQQALRGGYLATNPPSAIIHTENIDDVLLDDIGKLPAVSEVESQLHVDGLALVGERWRPIRLFVLDDFQNNQIGLVEPVTGAWPPSDREIVLERSSLSVARIGLGDDLRLGVVHGHSLALPVSGIVRDSGLAPGWMENVIYGFITSQTLSSLGGSPNFDQIQIVVGGNKLDEDFVRGVAFEVKTLIESTGRAVHDVSVPEANQHVHAEQMDSLLFVQAALGLLALVLSAVLILNLMTAILAGQAREIGVMKALGASPGQVVGIYLALAVLLGVTASALAIPIALWAGNAYAEYVAGLLNFHITDYHPRAYVVLLQLAAGALLPLVATIVPVYRASRMSVVEALRDYGISDRVFGSGVTDRVLGRASGPTRPLLLSLRNSFRRRLRLVLTLLALAIGGAVFLGTLNLRTSIRQQVTTTFDAMHFDITVGLAQSYPYSEIEQVIADVGGIASSEACRFARASLVYDDKTLGNAFAINGLPPRTELVEYPLLEGRWLESGDSNALVVNNQFIDVEPDVQLGDKVTVQTGGQESEWVIVGIVVSSPSRPIAYASRDFLSELAGEPGRGNHALVAVSGGDAVNREQLLQQLELGLAGAGLEVEMAHLMQNVRVVMEDHLLMVAAFLVVMSLIIIVVGGLGLATTMSLAVLERTREIGVMRAIGAPHKTIHNIILVEGLFIGMLSCLIAIPLSVPMSLVVGNAFGQIMFQAPIAFVATPSSLVTWMAIVLVVSTMASFFPALNATQKTLAETLAFE